MPPYNNSAKNQLLLTYSILAVIVFLLLLITGGLFSNVNKLIFSEISFIISPYSQNSDLSIRLFQIYNLILLSISLLLGLRLHNIYAKLGATYLLLSALFGLLLIELPMDPLGRGDTPQGIAHIISVTLLSLYLMAALQLFAKAFKNTQGLKWMSKYTYITSIIILVGGAITGLFATFSLRLLVGLVEKLPIAAFLVWLLRTSFAIMRLGPKKQ